MDASDGPGFKSVGADRPCFLAKVPSTKLQDCEKPLIAIAKKNRHQLDSGNPYIESLFDRAEELPIHSRITSKAEAMGGGIGGGAEEQKGSHPGGDAGWLFRNAVIG